MTALFVQPDQLCLETALFRDRDPSDTPVILMECMDEFNRVRFHKQRLTLVFSAMRHFAAELEEAGFTVSYYRCCEDPVTAFREAAKAGKFDEVRFMASAEYRASDRYRRRAREAGLRTTQVDNDMFISNRFGEAARLEAGTSTRMETFYRKLRKATGILMDDDEPVGGSWNYDKENRRPPKAGMETPAIPEYPPDKVTQAVMRDVAKHFPEAFGELDTFSWPVTRADAEDLLDDFLEQRLPQFGDFQDAMISGNASLFHSLVSAPLNLGLLAPEAVCREAEARLRNDQAPLNAVEGFVRQILGWREFVYQLYQANMPDYDGRNALGAEAPLPPFYWDGETRMRCVSEAIRPVLETGLNHHIQRLMITGNFGLLAGVSPQALNEWYWLAYIDAWHWVVTPNVIGMATYADGGLMGSKPYAASANYINKMSNYCKHCPYDPKKTAEDDACPFNALYWDFLARNKKALEDNPRMALSYRNLGRKGSSAMQAIRKRAEAVRKAAADGTL